MVAPVIQVERLNYQWASDFGFGLQVDQLDLESNERLFIHGPSGSGKTTLLSLLVGILRPQRGHIKLLGQSLGELGGGRRDHLRADHIGMIFQQFNLIPYLTPLENVLLTCQFSALRKQRALAKSSSLEREAMRLLSHLDMAAPQALRLPVHQLSVGQQQRVAAARALMGSPELIVADEPTSSLDSDRREQFVELLFNECRSSGSALLFVSHDHQLANLFDRQVRLQHRGDKRVELTEQELTR